MHFVPSILLCALHSDPDQLQLRPNLTFVNGYFCLLKASSDLQSFVIARSWVGSRAPPPSPNVSQVLSHSSPNPQFCSQQRLCLKPPPPLQWPRPRMHLIFHLLTFHYNMKFYWAGGWNFTLKSSPSYIWAQKYPLTIKFCENSVNVAVLVIMAKLGNLEDVNRPKIWTVILHYYWVIWVQPRRKSSKILPNVRYSTAG